MVIQHKHPIYMDVLHTRLSKKPYYLDHFTALDILEFNIKILHYVYRLLQPLLTDAISGQDYHMMTLKFCPIMLFQSRMFFAVYTADLTNHHRFLSFPVEDHISSYSIWGANNRPSLFILPLIQIPY
jgi:hypothetical protein